MGGNTGDQPDSDELKKGEDSKEENTDKHAQSIEPVDLVTGAYLYEHTDFKIDERREPRALGFTRYYNSKSRFNNAANLGHGWTHNYYSRITERSAVDAGLGQSTPEDMASLIIATIAAQDVYDGGLNVKDWTVASLIIYWGMEQLYSNAVSVTLGNKTLQFIKLPKLEADGTQKYLSPAGVTAELTKTTDTNFPYILQERLGNIFRFDTNLRLKEIEDVDGKKMSFNYHADGRLDIVTDAYSRSLKFNYDSNLLIQSISNNFSNSD